MTANDTSYFISEPKFGSADAQRWQNSYHFLEQKRDPNYSQQEVEHILNKVSHEQKTEKNNHPAGA